MINTLGEQTILVKTSNKEEIVKDNTKINNLSIDEIEDEFDLKLAKEAYEEYVKDGKKSRPISKLRDELDL